MKKFVAIAALCLGISLGLNVCHAQQLVDAPVPAAFSSSVSGSGSVIQNPPVIQPKKNSLINPTSMSLFSADLLVRVLDAYTTRHLLSDPCGCYQENLLPPSIAGSGPAMYTYSIGTSAILGGASYLLYKHGHHKLAYLIPSLDIGITGGQVIHNTLLRPQPITVTTHVAGGASDFKNF